MLLSLNSMPIKYKLILSVYVFLVIVFTVSFSFVIYQEINHRHSELIVEAKVFNQILSQDFVSIISLGDVDKSADMTSRLRAINKVQGITVYNKKRLPIFYYKQENIEALTSVPVLQENQHAFVDESLLLFDEIKYNGTVFGYISIQLSSSEVNETIIRNLKQAAMVMFFLFIGLFFLAWLIQRYFSGPIQQLASALRRIAITHDYTNTLPVDRKDEIGDLFQGVNNLQKQIEEEKKALQDQQFAFDQHCIVGITDANGVITYANDLFVKVSGYSKSELIGNNHKILSSHYHDAAFFGEMYRNITRGEIWHGDICNKAKDGHEYWLATTIVPLIGENGKPLSYIAMRTDITVQKNVESSLSRAQEMVNMGSWELDLIRNNLTWSAEVYRIFEIDHDKFSATYELFLDVVHPADRELVDKTYTESLEKRLPYEIEHRLLMKDGRIKIVREQCETFYDDTGKAIRSTGVVHDITNSKQTEEALRRSQKMDAVGQLTGGIAHDFNNIMGIILGNIELLELQGNHDEELFKRIDPIKKSAERAAKLTKQLLAFSRRKSDQLIVININQLVSDMKNLIVHSVTPEIEVEYKLSDDLWLTRVDPGDLQDSILNIVINARDAMSNSGHLTIESSNCHLDGKYCMHNPGVVEGDYVQLRITDDGEGITPEQQQHIFEPFYTTKAEGSGTGLGLAMVFGFIERSQAHIKVHSEVGEGTTFSIYLPKASLKSEVSIGSSEKKSELILKGKETILIVDDEEGLRGLAKEILETLGYSVLATSNGKMALDVLEKNQNIDLLFSDVVMPGGVNGYELAEQVTVTYPQIKILLTSGHTQKALIGNGRATFPFDILNKPYSRPELANKIREMLD